jgi:hypothetical protein
MVEQFGFTNAAVRTSRVTGESELSVKDQKHRFHIAFGCDSRHRIATIKIDSEQSQIGSAADPLDTLIDSFTAPLDRHFSSTLTFVGHCSFL